MPRVPDKTIEFKGLFELHRVRSQARKLNKNRQIIRDFQAKSPRLHLLVLEGFRPQAFGSTTGTLMPYFGPIELL